MGHGVQSTTDQKEVEPLSGLRKLIQLAALGDAIAPSGLSSANSGPQLEREVHYLVECIGTCRREGLNW